MSTAMLLGILLTTALIDLITPQTFNCASKQVLTVNEVILRNNIYEVFYENFQFNVKKRLEHRISAVTDTNSEVDISARVRFSYAIQERFVDAILVDPLIGDVMFKRNGHCVWNAGRQTTCDQTTSNTYPFAGLKNVRLGFTLKRVHSVSRMPTFENQHYIVTVTANVCHNMTSGVCRRFETDAKLHVILDQALNQITTVNYSVGFTDALPTALVYIDSNRFMVFFGPFWSLYIINIPLVSAIMIDPTLRHRLSNSWLGCPPQLCFEGDIDAAVTMGNDTLLFRAQHFYRTPQPLSSRVPINTFYHVNSEFQGANGHVDAAAFIGGQIYLFQRRFFSVFDVTTKQRVSGPVSIAIGFDLPGVHVDAAITTGNTLYLFHEELISEYTLNGRNKPTLQPNSNNRLNQYFDGSPRDIHAALAVANNRIYLFKGDFYYESVGITRGGKVQPKLAAGNLYQCLDSFYTDIEADKHLNIRSLVEFEAYALNFQSVADDSAKTSSNGNSAVNAASTDTLKTLIIVGACTIGVLLLVLAISMSVIIRKSKQAESEPLSISSSTKKDDGSDLSITSLG